MPSWLGTVDIPSTILVSRPHVEVEEERLGFPVRVVVFPAMDYQALASSTAYAYHLHVESNPSS